ncbi:MAG: zinc ribbon domain-containing protein [Bacteroidales bacterium]|nr:zinc ribbon domain-containing protein [Bacteroidales bacterium]
MSKTFTCKSCGHIFEGGPATRKCPVCGSSDIKVGGNGKLPKWVKPVLIAVAIIIVIILLLKCTGGDPTLQPALSEKGGMVIVTIDNVSPHKLKSNYNVQVLFEQELLGIMGFNPKTGEYNYALSNLLVGNCYTFRVVTKKGEPVAKVQWKTSNQYCLETPPPAPSFDVKIVPNEETKRYTVTIIVDDTSSADQFAFESAHADVSGIKWQPSNEFRNVEHGEYVAYARNSSGIHSEPRLLPIIKKKSKPLTASQIQGVLDAVSAGRMTVSTAQDSIASGNVNLRKSIHTSEGGTLSTLFSVLQEASWGTYFKLQGFQIDQRTNKIMSGSLDVSVR